MNIVIKEQWILFISFVISIFSIVASFGFITYEAYIRWTLNQNFTFVGGNKLEVLIVSAFGLLLGLNYINRSRN